MATDARFSTNLASHPKVKKLRRRLGADGCWAWVCLVLWVAANRSDGDLTGMDDEDVELSADWRGELGALVRELIDLRMLDGEQGAHVVHDWTDHNPWAAGSDARSLKASWNAIKRHHGAAEADRLVPEYAAIRNAASNAGSTGDDDGSNTPSPSPSPSPSPIPPPTEFLGAVAPMTRRPPKPAKANAEDDPAFMAAWRLYPRRSGDSRADAFKAWRARIAAGATPEQLTDGVKRYAAYCTASGTEGKFIKQGATFFGPGEHYLSDWAFEAPAKVVSGQEPITVPSNAADVTKAQHEAEASRLADPAARAAAEAARIEAMRKLGRPITAGAAA